jgi:hypothetical protein
MNNDADQTKSPGDLQSDPPRDLTFAQAQLAYSIIENLIEHTRIVSDLIALMAQVLDEDTTKALTQTPTWTAYLDSRRSLEKTKADVEKFAEVLQELKPDQ